MDANERIFPVHLAWLFAPGLGYGSSGEQPADSNPVASLSAAQIPAGYRAVSLQGSPVLIVPQSARVLSDGEFLMTDTSMSFVVSRSANFTAHFDACDGIDDLPVRPSAFALAQNYPNPCNPLTVIKYTIGGNRSVPSSSWTGRDSRSRQQAGPEGEGSGARGVSLIVYDMLGSEVAVLVNERKSPGSYVVSFDGSGLACGTYFYRLTSGIFVETKKALLVR